MLTLAQIYAKVVEIGMKNDPRPASELKRILAEEKKAYEKLDAKAKKYFDTERLTNPYPDTRILTGDPKTKIKKLIAGIDFEVGDLAMTAELNRRGEGIDLAVSHHPEGQSLARLSDAMSVQEDIYEAEGIPINIMQRLLAKEYSRIEQGVHAINHEYSVDAARLLGIPYACFHTVADNCVFTFLKKIMDTKKPRTVGDVCDLLLEQPEYIESAKRQVAPLPVTGSRKARAGRVVVTGFTGGTSGSAEVYEAMKHAGIGTEIVMHCSKEHREQAEKHHITVIVAGHMASDSLGMNLLFDQIERAGVQIVAAGGYRRFARK